MESKKNMKNLQSKNRLIDTENIYGYQRGKVGGGIN